MQLPRRLVVPVVRASERAAAAAALLRWLLRSDWRPGVVADVLSLLLHWLEVHPAVVQLFRRVQLLRLLLRSGWLLQRLLLRSRLQEWRLLRLQVMLLLLMLLLVQQLL